jgi:hypothetical protein
MKTRGAASFVSANPNSSRRCSIRFAYRRIPVAGARAGIEFFTWARRMTVDAFYTSEIGIKDIDYRGNRPMGSYPEPKSK